MKRNDIKEINQISSYKMENIFNVHSENGMYFYNLYNTIQINPDDLDPASYTTVRFKIGDYWTKMAYEAYGNVELWWVICVTNQIHNPLNLPSPGTELKILNKGSVSRVLGQIIQDAR